MVVCYFPGPVLVLTNPVLLDFGVEISMLYSLPPLGSQTLPSIYGWSWDSVSRLFPVILDVCFVIHRILSLSPLFLSSGVEVFASIPPPEAMSFSASGCETVCCLFPSGAVF